MPVRAWPDLSWYSRIEPRGRSLLRPGWVGSGLPFSRRAYPLLSRLRSHHDRASGHFFSDALRFRCAREVGSEGSRSPLASVIHSIRGHPARWRPPWPTHPRSRSWGSGHQRVSISTEGSCSRRAAIAFQDADSAELASLGPFFFVSSLIACDLSRSWQYTQLIRPCPRHYGSSLGHRRVASLGPFRCHR